MSRKRAVMQASEPAIVARNCGCSRFYAVLRRQWRQRACLRRRGKGFGRMQQLFVREGLARAGAVVVSTMHVRCRFQVNYAHIIAPDRFMLFVVSNKSTTL